MVGLQGSNCARAANALSLWTISTRRDGTKEEVSGFIPIAKVANWKTKQLSACTQGKAVKRSKCQSRRQVSHGSFLLPLLLAFKSPSARPRSTFLFTSTCPLHAGADLEMTQSRPLQVCHCTCNPSSSRRRVNKTRCFSSFRRLASHSLQ